MRSVELGIAAVLALLPMLLAGFIPKDTERWFARLSVRGLMAVATVLCVPYLLVSIGFGCFRAGWFGMYAVLPAVVVGGLGWARAQDPEGRGTWVDALVLGLLGLAVDLRWMERAWPPHLGVFNKVVLLDLGILGFQGARLLTAVGFDLRLRGADLLTGVREFAWYAPLAIAGGLALGFLHVHRGWPRPLAMLEAALFTFFLIAVPEELFFRGWMQNLLERRLGGGGGLLVTAMLFGLAHFNKRAAHFNWRYVLLAMLAGVAYGRAWRRERRVGASAVTHTLVDTVWSLILR